MPNYHTSEYARLLQLVSSDLSAFAVDVYHNYRFVPELLIGLLIVYLAYRLGRMLNRSSSARKIEVLNSFEESKERLSEKQQHTFTRLKRFKLFLKALCLMVVIANLYLHLQSD